jgi:phospholipid/cholesterol/gamma-HCH transport system permease protein
MSEVAPPPPEGGPPAGDAAPAPPPADATAGGAAPGAGGPTVGRAAWHGVEGAFQPVLRFLDLVGGHVILLMRALSWLPRRPVRARNYLAAAEYIGFGSLPIVLLVGAFTGMVMSLQMVVAFGQFDLESVSGGTTGKALALELAPVLTALMLSGRAGAGIATELGTMRITEQIDALESMAVNPVQYLVLPRLVAAMIVTPLLTLLFFVIAMAGAYLVAVPMQGVDHGHFISNVKKFVALQDVMQGVIKAAVFGLVVILVGCYQGLHASGGGRGVGIGTTRAVVIASVTVLVLDYFLSDILLRVLGRPGGG